MPRARKYTANANNMYPCPHCDAEFPQTSGVSRHIKKLHPTPQIDITPTIPLREANAIEPTQSQTIVVEVEADNIQDLLNDIQTIINSPQAKPIRSIKAEITFMDCTTHDIQYVDDEYAPIVIEHDEEIDAKLCEPEIVEEDMEEEVVDNVEQEKKECRDLDEVLEDVAESVSVVIGNDDLRIATYHIINNDVGLDCDSLDNFSAIMTISLKSMKQKQKQLKNYNITQINDMWREYVESVGLDIEIEQYDAKEEENEADEEENKRRIQEVAENVAGQVLITDHALRDLTYTIITKNVGLNCKTLGEFNDIMVASLKDMKDERDPNDKRRKLLKIKVKNYTEKQIEELWEAYHNEIYG